jgi:lipopolysaccharide export LptBFGC system permease protein LptF
MRTLDRHLAGQFARNATMVATATVVVFVVLDVLLGFQLLTRPAPSPWTKVELFASRIPGLLNFAIPVAAVISVLATAAPMLRRGEFTALGAAGITLQRSTRALLIGCLLFGVVDTVIADLATPPSTARALALQDMLEGQSREGRVWRADDGTTWFASGAKLVGVPKPGLERVVAATSEVMVLADRVVWDGARWLSPDGCIVLRVIDGAQRLERMPPGDLPAEIALNQPPEQLYRRLLPRYTMSSRELLARGERADLATVWSRLVRFLVPVLASMAALAVFVRFHNRDRIAVATVEAVAAGLIPVALLMLSAMAADTAPGPPGLAVVVGCGIASILPIWLWWRWRI